MAAPTLSLYLYNGNVSPPTLAIITSETCTFVAAAGGVKLTDAAGLLWKDAGTSDSTGLEDDPFVMTMVRDLAGTPGTANTVDVPSDTFENAGMEGNNTVTAAALVLAVYHAAPYTRDDLAAVFSFLSTTTTAGDFDDFTLPEIGDYVRLASDLLAEPPGNYGYLLLAPRAMTQAQALLTALDKYALSSKGPDAFNELNKHITALRVAMPASGTFGITAAGT